jgi:transposase InsO family protein
MLGTLQRLGVMPSFSRPSVRNDNAYSEFLFKTLKPIFRTFFEACLRIFSFHFSMARRSNFQRCHFIKTNMYVNILFDIRTP